MSRQKNLPRYLVYDNVDSTTNPASVITNVSGMDKVRYHIEMDSTVRGEFFVQVSSERENPTDFETLNFNEQLLADGTEDIIDIEITQVSFNHIRLLFTNDSGSGVFLAYISGKSVGA